MIAPDTGRPFRFPHHSFKNFVIYPRVSQYVGFAYGLSFGTAVGASLFGRRM